MAHPDRGIPLSERVVASIQFGSFDLHRKHAVQEQPFRDRIVFTTPDHSQIEAIGFALDGNGQVDLRDLDLKSVGNEEVDEEYVARELESMGHHVRRTPERYKPAIPNKAAEEQVRGLIPEVATTPDGEPIHTDAYHNLGVANPGYMEPRPSPIPGIHRPGDEI